MSNFTQHNVGSSAPQAVITQNIRTIEYYNINVTIPPNTPSYTQSLLNNLPFPSFAFNEALIESIDIYVNSNSIYNVPKTEVVIVNGVNTSFPAGFYSQATLANMLQINVSPFTNLSSATVTLDFTKAPNILNITGFNVMVVGVGGVGTTTFNVTNGFDVVSITSNLMQLSDPSGLKYVNKIRLLDSQGNSVTLPPATLNIPIIQNSTNSVTWNLFKKDGKTPFTFANTVDIYLKISAYQRSPQRAV